MVEQVSSPGLCATACLQRSVLVRKGTPILHTNKLKLR